MAKRPHISVCVCTYKRPRYLARLLLALNELERGSLFDYSIVIVDNDRLASAKETVETFSRDSTLSVHYSVQPEQNIAITRNVAVAKADGDFVAFIDDDEFPGKEWLLELYKAIDSYGADGMLAPVLPDFEKKPPQWVVKGRFFDRPIHSTGQTLNWENTRTGNVLLKRSIFEADRQWFDSNYGSGGEDRDFFRRRIGDGAVFRWCNEAPVYETVPPARWKRTFLLKRALLRGKVAFQNSHSKTSTFLKSLIAVLVYTVGLPFLLFVGHHLFMRYLIKTFDHLGKILIGLRIDLVKEKYVIERTPLGTSITL